jgi:hypothetical protein
MSISFKHAAVRARVWLGVTVMGLTSVLAACEDEGNPGDDSLLGGASLVVVVLIVVAIFFMVRRRRG